MLNEVKIHRWGGGGAVETGGNPHAGAPRITKAAAARGLVRPWNGIWTVVWMKPKPRPARSKNDRYGGAPPGSGGTAHVHAEQRARAKDDEDVLPEAGALDSDGHQDLDVDRDGGTQGKRGGRLTRNHKRRATAGRRLSMEREARPNSPLSRISRGAGHRRAAHSLFYWGRGSGRGQVGLRGIRPDRRGGGIGSEPASRAWPHQQRAISTSASYPSRAEADDGHSSRTFCGCHGVLVRGDRIGLVEPQLGGFLAEAHS